MTMKNGRSLRLFLVYWLSLLSCTTSHLRGIHHRHLSQQQQGRPYAYELWSSSRIHSTLLDWKLRYPNLVRVTTAQEAYGLPTAGTSSDCPFDTEVDGCLNYILTIQDYIVHPEESDSSNRLPEVFWSGELHGNERVGPTATMEAASLLLRAASCEATYEYNPAVHRNCSFTLQDEFGMTKRQRQWLARLVSTRRIIVVPTANALGYYRGVRTEGDYDVNRDFPFDYDTTTTTTTTEAHKCMRTIGGRTLNEIFRTHLIQMALTFHGGTEVIGYEWGADSYKGVLSPDDTAQVQIASAYSKFGSGWNTSSPYKIGPMDQTVYTIQGGMEDWAYGGSWLSEKVVQCQPTTFGGYPSAKTIYNDSMLRAFNMLIETSDDKVPAASELGTTLNILDQDTSGNGHVSRNVRLSLLSADLVEPYVSFLGVDNVSLATDILPLTGRNCMRMNAVKVPGALSQVTVEWTVGGALEIDDTSLLYGNWSDVMSQVNCLTQPSNTLESYLVSATMISSTNGTGYFSSTGASPSLFNATDAPLGPVFSATIDLSSYSHGDEIIVVAKARVDQSWLHQPNGIAPLVPPQAHVVNARTNATWFHQNNNKIVQGRLDWYSVIPLTIVIHNDTTEIQDYAAVFEETTAPTTAPTISLAPTVSPTANPTVLPTVNPTLSPTRAPVSPSYMVSVADGPTNGLYENPRCAAHSQCLFFGLADNCCPTFQGIYLDCCGF